MSGTATAGTEGARHRGVLQRRVRWLFLRGLSAVITGVLVLGLGGRLVMLASRMLHPDAVGRTTDSGNLVGAFTLEGTIGLIVFGGLLGGLAAGVLWVLTAEWMPRRWWVVGLATTALGSPFLIDADNRDFVILDPPAVDLLLLLMVLFAFGAVLVAVDGRLTRRMRPSVGTTGTAGQAVVLALVSPLVVPTFGGFLSSEFCSCDDPPWWIGVLLILAAIASIWWWVAQIRGRDEQRSRAERLGRPALAAAVVAAMVDLGVELVHVV